ncbi:MAG: hypothetical protein U9Q03_05255 [Patescibacteria group bacterium]|nr:hypothetical protein [Patescibacteria group bacterium]
MGYKCERCNDTGWIPDYLGGGFINEPCPCRKAGHKQWDEANGVNWIERNGHLPLERHLGQHDRRGVDSTPQG